MTSESEAAGFRQDDWYCLPLRIYYEDTDAGGIVYYANYLRFAERARTEMLRHAGIEQQGFRAQNGLIFAVSSCQIHYRQPARLDDRIIVKARVEAMTAARIKMQQEIWRDGDRLADLEVQIVCLREDGRPARVPPMVKASLELFTREGKAD